MNEAIEFAEWVYKSCYRVSGGGELLWWNKSYSLLGAFEGDTIDTQKLYDLFISSTKIKVIYTTTEDNNIYELFIEKYNNFEGADIHDMQVLKSAAGYYIGQLSLLKGTNHYIPEMRDSQCYWQERKEAEDALITGKYPVKF